MTTYSKLCPKCQNPCDLAAPSCKRCGLKFGQPIPETPVATPEQTRARGRVTIVATIIGVLLIVVAIQLFGDAQERAARKREADKNTWEAVQRRMNSGR
jgi:predicted amidophosphoribosyltransferase